MLSSVLSERMPSGECKVHTVIVEEADFVTIYWLLKWVYTNWLLFKEEDDLRSAVEGTGASWSVCWLGTRGTAAKWDWKMFNKGNAADDDIVSAVSGDSTPSLQVVDGRGSSSMGMVTYNGADTCRYLVSYSIFNIMD